MHTQLHIRLLSGTLALTLMAGAAAAQAGQGQASDVRHDQLARPTPKSTQVSETLPLADMTDDTPHAVGTMTPAHRPAVTGSEVNGLWTGNVRGIN